MMKGRLCPKKRDAVAEAICSAEGMPCYRAKRGAEAVAEALALPEAELRLGFGSHSAVCR